MRTVPLVMAAFWFVALAVATPAAQASTLGPAAIGDCSPSYVYPSPPPGFDPVSATSTALAKYGFPPRPAGPSSVDPVEGWAKILGSITDFRAVIDDCPAAGGGSFTLIGSANWAGHAVPASYYNQSTFQGISSEWVVPEVVGDSNYTDCGEPNTSLPPNAASWAGLGYRYLIQAGTVSCADGTPRYRFWNENLPDDPIYEGPPVHPRDLVGVWINYQGNDSCYYLESNETTGVSRAFTEQCTHHNNNGGVEANFILERAGSHYLPTFWLGSHVSDNWFWTANQDWQLSGGESNDKIIMTSDCTLTGQWLSNPSGVSNHEFDQVWYNNSPYQNYCP